VVCSSDNFFVVLSFARNQEILTEYRLIYESAGVPISSADRPIVLMKAATRWF
jgi:hypothetical protein